MPEIQNRVDEMCSSGHRFQFWWEMPAVCFTPRQVKRNLFPIAKKKRGLEKETKEDAKKKKSVQFIPLGSKANRFPPGRQGFFPAADEGSVLTFQWGPRRMKRRTAKKKKKRTGQRAKKNKINKIEK